jgi:beta-glucanase (GH16 family)
MPRITHFRALNTLKAWSTSNWGDHIKIPDVLDGTEIDIVEIPWRDGKITMNLHWDGYGKDHKSAGTSMTMTNLTEGFHDYGLCWTPDEYVFYVDGREVWRSQAGGVSQVPEYLKLTEEIGDSAGNIRKAKLPDYFEVDYVRVYELSK